MLARVSRLNLSLFLLVISVILICLFIGLAAVRFSDSVIGLLGGIPSFSPILIVAFISLLFLVLGWIMAKPEAGLVLMILVLPLQESVFGYPGLILSWLPVAALAIFCSLSFTMGKPKINLSSNVPQLLAIAFFGYTVLSLLFHLQETQGAVFYKWSIQALLMFTVLGIVIKDRSQLNRVVYCLAGLVAVVAIIGLQQKASPYDYMGYINGYFWHGRSVLQSSQVFRITSVFQDPNHLANFLVTCLLVCFPFLFAWKATAQHRLLTFAALALVVIGIYFTFSAGGWISLGVGLAFLWLLSSSKAKARAISVIVLVSLMVLLLSAYGIISLDNIIPEDLQAKFTALRGVTGGLSELEQGSLGARAHLIHSMLDMFRQNPLFGTGMGSFQVLILKSEYLITLNIPSKPGLVQNYPHNSYMFILAELGIVGMLLLGIAISSVIVIGVRNIRRTKDSRLRYLQMGTLAAIFANLVFLFTYGTIMYNLNFWLTMGLTLAIRRVIQGEIEASTLEN